jgi:hypothetical protein
MNTWQKVAKPDRLFRCFSADDEVTFGLVRQRKCLAEACFMVDSEYVSASSLSRVCSSKSPIRPEGHIIELFDQIFVDLEFRLVLGGTAPLPRRIGNLEISGYCV